MDVYCTTCSEPWDTHHLLQDVIHDTQLGGEEILLWRQLAIGERLNDVYRDALMDAGWHFGRSLVNVTRCPACLVGAYPDPDKLHFKAELEEMLAGDLDGLIAEYAELDL